MRQIKLQLTTAYLGLASDKKLFTILVMIITITIDSQIGYIADFIPQQLSSDTGITIFIAIAAIFVVIQHLILWYLMHHENMGVSSCYIHISMTYYLIEYPLFVLGYFTPSEDTDAMTNILIFSTAALLSGIIFGAAFLSVARTLRKDSSLRKHMIIAAYGFVLFYIAGSASVAQAAYPPYGIVSVSFIGLSCYLIYVGLYSSAVTVSQDTTLRLSIRKSITDQTKFLDSMGSAHTEQELQSTVLKIAKKHADVLTEKTGVEASMTEGDIKEYMAMVMYEIHKS